jgi:hypothetical protein
MTEWLTQLLSFSEVTWAGVLTGVMLFVITSLGGAALVAFVLVKLPANYFCDSRPRDFWLDRHPVLRWTGLILKNLAGLALVVVGLVLSLPGIPGPGVLTMLLGLMLLDFPGKRRLERRLIGRPGVYQAINRLRRRHGKGPLVLEDVGVEAK